MRTRGYAVAGLVSLISLILSIVAVQSTTYIVTATPREHPLFESRYGLFRRCDRAVGLAEPWRCRRYPKRQLDCPARPRSASTATPGFASTTGGLSETAKLRFSALMGLRKPNDDLLDLDVVQALRVDEGERTAEEDGDRSRFGPCHQYQSAGYAAQLAVAIAACATVCFILVVLPPIASRERKVQGWKVAAGLTGIHAALQLVSTSLVAHVLRTSGRFPDSSGLGPGFALATASWGLGVLLVAGLVWAEIAGVARLPDHGYTTIPDGE